MKHSLTLLLYCPCLCCHSILWLDVVFLCGSESVQIFNVCLYMYWRWRSSYQERRVGIPLTGLKPPHVCACSKLGPRFQRHMSWSFFMSEWLLFNVNWAIFQLSWGKQDTFWWDDKYVCLVLDQHSEFYFHSASYLKQQSTGRHVTPLGHINLIPNQTVFAIAL